MGGDLEGGFEERGLVALVPWQGQNGDLAVIRRRSSVLILLGDIRMLIKWQEVRISKFL